MQRAEAYEPRYNLDDLTGFAYRNGRDEFSAGELVEIDEILEEEDDDLSVDEDDQDLTQECPRNTDSVSSVSGYVQLRKKHMASELYAKYSNLAIEELFTCMRAEQPNSPMRAWLKDEIFFRVFFLLPHVVKRNYKMKSHLFNDVIQNMSQEVLIAIEKFDPSLGFKFTNYLAGYFKSSMTKTFKDTNVVSVPTGRRKKLRELAQQDGLLSEEIVSYTGIKYDSNSAAGCIEIEFERTLHNRELLEWLEEAISKEAGVLSDDARLIIQSHYSLFDADQLSYREIAELRKKCGSACSLSRISQIHAKAIEQLRKYFEERQIEEY